MEENNFSSAKNSVLNGFTAIKEDSLLDFV